MPSPARAGWRMPSEWHRHEATWLAWPHNADDWPGKFQAIPWVFADIIHHLHTGEKVNLLVNDDQAEKRVIKILRRVGVDLGQVIYFHIPTDRAWTRDYGPIFLTNPKGEVGFTNWRFNAWVKYDDWRKDDAVPDRLAETLAMPHWKPAVLDVPVVLEGGSIDVNGEGLLLTTEECLLSDVQRRNPTLSRTDLERVFADFLGIRKVLWLGRGIAGDDTHGHVDDLARFVGPRTVVAVVEKNAADPNYEPLQDNLRRLQEMADLDGRRLQVVTLPMPEPVFFEGRRLPASYANFYIANEKVLVPTFNDSQDRIALGTLAELFPGRTVVGIHALDLVWGLGTLHCMTQQQPAT
ncbi:MAG: agmatine deiminase family protein [Planctomycetes bacterium]|nr:agmatine deiminase family protein [Planctomycetota bacterium]